jgi:ABC-2 type transport system permease protein
MKKFLTLIKRDLAENRGSLIITPMAIAAFIFTLMFVSILMGKFQFQGDNFNFGASDAQIESSINTDDHHYKIYKENGILYKDDGTTKEPLVGKVDENSQKAISQIFVMGSAVGAMFPIAIALVAILFILAGALYDERKERNIMFWKSLPISDLQTASAKIASIVGGGIGFAVLSSFVLHISMMLLVAIAANIMGIKIPDASLLNFGIVISTTAQLWLDIVIVLFGYAFWALPIYGWFLACSAFAPKSPFFWAILPIGILPLLAKIFTSSDTMVSYALTPLQHLTGEPIVEAFGKAFRNINNSQEVRNSEFAIDMTGVFHTFANPQLWIGVIIGAGFIYLASEIRRRKAL